MDPAALLALYDRFERRDARPVGFHVERGARTVRHVGAPGELSWVIWSDLAGVDADAAIAAEQARFAALRQGVEWKHFAHDAPADLLARLVAAGFDAGEPEELLVYDLQDPPAWSDADAGHDVRRVGLAAWADLAHVLGSVWPHVLEGFLPGFRDEVAAAPERVALFVGYVDGAPASAAWSLDGGPATPFLGLFGGATLPAQRGRGLYRALVAARAREAHARGKRFLTVDAGPMSAPILQRLGFVRLTTTTPCTWHPPGA